MHCDIIFSRLQQVSRRLTFRPKLPRCTDFRHIGARYTDRPGFARPQIRVLCPCPRRVRAAQLNRFFTNLRRKGMADRPSASPSISSVATVSRGRLRCGSVFPIKLNFRGLCGLQGMIPRLAPGVFPAARGMA